jgi:hypothetical protein
MFDHFGVRKKGNKKRLTVLLVHQKVNEIIVSILHPSAGDLVIASLLLAVSLDLLL